MSLGRFSEAITILNQGLGIHQDEPHLLASRGDAFLKMGEKEGSKEDLRRAEDDLQRAVDLDEHIYNAVYVHLAEAKWSLGNHDEAIRILDESLNRKPGDVLSLDRRGCMHYRNRNYEAAVSDFTDLIEKMPENALARFNRARAYWGLGNRENLGHAVDDISEAITSGEHTEMFLNLRVDIYMNFRDQEHAELALQDLNTLLNLNQHDPILLVKRAFTHTVLEMPAEARDDFDRAILEHPDNLFVQRSYGMYLRSTGSLNEAEIVFRKVLSRAPDDTLPTTPAAADNEVGESDDIEMPDAALAADPQPEGSELQVPTANPAASDYSAGSL